MRRGVRFKMKRDYSVSECGVVDDDKLRGMDESERMKLVDDRLYRVRQHNFLF